MKKIHSPKPYYRIAGNDDYTAIYSQKKLIRVMNNCLEFDGIIPFYVCEELKPLPRPYRLGHSKSSKA